MMNLFKKIFGTKNDRELKKFQPLLARIAAFEPALAELSREGLRAKTDEFRERIRTACAAEQKDLDALLAEEAQERSPDEEEEEGEAERRAERIKAAKRGVRETERLVLDEILPEAFAVVREASRRTIGLRQYDVQLLGGMVLHRGSISEMKTGEGKTLVATAPLYLNALTGRGCHLVTVNDYLARRDVQWMGPIFHLLGIRVAAIVHDASFLFDPDFVVRDYRMLNLRPIERKEAYEADITYGTNHEFGFDYLRDNMKFALEDYVQRELNYAIVDEVDNILIDEARTPLIISGPAEVSTDKYFLIDRVIPRLRKGTRKEKQHPDDRPEETGDYWVDEKARNAVLTEQGVAKVERLLNIPNLYDPRHIDVLHHVNQALKAHAVFQRDVDYIIKDGQVVIVDEFTGRLMPGRRWSDGLHQAVEAKEGVRIERENQTLATITIQNYFRMYHKLAGMTGTADTESVEFKKIYKLDVVVIPPNQTMRRLDQPDVIYKTEREKFDAVVLEVKECHAKGQPVLVGTVSVEKSEQLAKLLKKDGIRHNVLNAVNHEAEANIIAQAGRFGTVTIATNMAGRGTDILLGGNAEFLARSELENQWIQKAAGSTNSPGQRYEDVLQKLRNEYDEAIQAARRQYEPLWKPHEERQAEALHSLTETHRELLEVRFWHHRASLEKAEAAWHGAPEKGAPALAEAVAAYRDALQEFDHTAGPFFEAEAQSRFLATVGQLLEALGSTPTTAAPLLTAFDRSRSEYERSIQKGLQQAPNEGESLREVESRHESIAAELREEEAAYAEPRRLFEEACAAAQAHYEETRREYTKVVEDVREEMEKGHDEAASGYEEVVRRYREVCVEDRAKVAEAGGLMIIGTERHESRRIDNQLRGRAGRQGDPGASRFFLSLEDDLLRIFGAERIQGMMTRLGMEEGEPIEHRLITRAVANAQSKVEAHNFDIRKHLIEYDDVMNQQREIVYARRREFLGRPNLKAEILTMSEGVAADIIDQYAGTNLPAAEWDWQALGDTLFKTFGIRPDLSEEEQETIGATELANRLLDRIEATYAAREEAFTPPVMRHLEKILLLQTLDTLWKDHLLSMDHLKDGIGLRGYAQKNPLQEYKKEGFELFGNMMRQFDVDVVEKVFTVQLARQEDLAVMEARQQQAPPQPMVMSGGGAAAPSAAPATSARRVTAPRPVAPAEDKVGRNDPCPCGSGKKYKKCHGS